MTPWRLHVEPHCCRIVDADGVEVAATPFADAENRRAAERIVRAVNQEALLSGLLMEVCERINNRLGEIFRETRAALGEDDECSMCDGTGSIPEYGHEAVAAGSPDRPCPLCTPGMRAEDWYCAY